MMTSFLQFAVVYLFCRSAMAWAEIPSPRPSAFIPSVVVALMLTSATLMPRASAIFFFIAGACGISFGRCASSVASTFRIVHPAASIFARTSRRNSRLDRFAVGRIGIRKMLADVSQRGGAQQRIANGMRKNIGIRVPFQPSLEGYLHSAENQFAPFNQAMIIDPLSDAKLRFAHIRAILFPRAS